MRNSLRETVGVQLDAALSSVGKPSDVRILSQSAFLRMLALERKRTERSHRSFVLMLLKSSSLLGGSKQGATLSKIQQALASSTRETDITGWYENGTTIGVIFTEIGNTPAQSVADTLLNKITNALCVALSAEQINEVSVSFHIYPEDSPGQDPPPPVNSALYPDLKRNAAAKKTSLGLKRAIDIAGSFFGLLFFAPLFVVIALLIKLTSKGPVLFRQQRIGHYGKPFTFLKFRSMRVNNDHSIHKEYVTQLISAKGAAATGRRDEPVVYKLTGDPRITKIGKFLRGTSLDELPQLFNVLKGDMSLVGPRPPVPYEFAAYAIWHRNRLLAVKPGITGLWQVAGRSRVTFDEMVRLDLRYATSWSLWLDLTILLQTPRAVITGQGAY